MRPHIGKLVKEKVEQKRITYKEFGALIHRNEKTIPDIYERESMSTDLLLTISEALKEDFIKYYYEIEPLKSLRNDEVSKLEAELDKLNAEIKRLKDTQQQLVLELSLYKHISESRKEAISFIKELKDIYQKMYKYAIDKSLLNEDSSSREDEAKLTTV